MRIRHLGSKGIVVGTRWGQVQFDDNGEADINIPEADLKLLPALKYVVLSKPDAPKVVEKPAVEPPKGDTIPEAATSEIVSRKRKFQQPPK